MSVKGGYSFYAVDTSDGAVAYACAPEFEEVESAAPSFLEFLELITAGRARFESVHSDYSTSAWASTFRIRLGSAAPAMPSRSIQCMPSGAPADFVRRARSTITSPPQSSNTRVTPPDTPHH